MPGKAMKYLIVNKFLYPNGGSETYIFGLGEALAKLGHEVQYFGMDDERNIVGNEVFAATPNMDFHSGGKLSKLTLPLKTIRSAEAAWQIRLVLEYIEPDVVHLNNFNFQITPSIIPEIRAWERETGHRVKILYTAHDYQLVCPNHMLSDIRTGQVCERCLARNGGRAGFLNCVRNRCIHGSAARSAVGMAEAVYWNRVKHVYDEIDLIVCPSEFLKEKMDTNPVFAKKTVALHNFMPAAVSEEAASDLPPADAAGAAENAQPLPGTDDGYVLYFGRYAREKGIATLLKVAKSLPEIPFVFAGGGPLEEQVRSVENVTDVGFLTGSELNGLIAGARFSVYPSEWYENCPYSVMESQTLGTPVLGADIGGIPELIKSGETGELFAAGDARALRKAVRRLWKHPELTDRYAENCRKAHFDDADEYCGKLLELVEKAGRRRRIRIDG